MTTQKRIAVVTGGNRGLGYAISRQLSQIGNRVILTSRNKTDGLVAKGGDRSTNIIAQAESGVIYSTALAFGQHEGDRTAIYVVTNGGMFLPPPTGVVPANVVRLEVGKTGYSLT